MLDGDSFTGGIPLPVHVITHYYEQYEEKDVTLTREEALGVASIDMTALVSSALPDAEILSRRVSVEERESEDGSVLVLIWDISCIEDIAAEAPIGVQ